MLQFISRRLGIFVVTFIGITLVTFTFIRMLPGDPVTIMMGERVLSSENHANVMKILGLDRSLWRQYLSYIYGLLRGDLGVSLVSHLPILDEFWPRFKATLELGFCAIIFATIVGIPFGVLAAVKVGSFIDYLSIFFH
ncbi:dipeptide transporter permease DppB [Candidatus Liberibacter americanus PW_SP]|nr:dipeptide transporter permease DppB [Candidatus Liberibacter americanus PW_SP]